MTHKNQILEFPNEILSDIENVISEVSDIENVNENEFIIRLCMESTKTRFRYPMVKEFYFGYRLNIFGHVERIVIEYSFLGNSIPRIF